MKRLTAAVLGLGRIGQGYDYDCADDSHVVTHASGFSHHPAFELVAGIDTNPLARKRFENKYAKPAFASVKGMADNIRPDVISIGVPTAQHAGAFAEALTRGPRAILCEKPIAGSTAEARQMVAAARENKCALLVNYMRRFEPGVLTLHRSITTGQYGEIYKGVAWYSKGLRNNGSHFIDLLRFLLGEVTACEVLSKGRRGDNGDPEPDVKIRFGTADIYLLAAREECFSIAEFELVGARGRIAYRNGGSAIQAWETGPDPDFPGYSILAHNPVAVPNDFMRHQWHVVDHLYRHLTAHVPLNSSGETAIATLQVVETLISKL